MMLPTDYLVWAALTLTGFVIVGAFLYLGLRLVADRIVDAVTTDIAFTYDSAERRPAARHDDDLRGTH